METKRRDYNQANFVANRAISKAKYYERKKFCEDLEKADEKGNVFRVAQQLVNKIKDVVNLWDQAVRNGKLHKQ